MLCDNRRSSRHLCRQLVQQYERGLGLRGDGILVYHHLWSFLLTTCLGLAPGDLSDQHPLQGCRTVRIDQLALKLHSVSHYIIFKRSRYEADLL